MALSEVLAKFGFEVDDSKLKKGESAAKAFTDKLSNIGSAVAGGVFFSGVKSFLGNIVEVGDNLGDTAAQLNVSASDLQRWNFIAESGGASAEDMATALKLVQKNASAAAEGTGGAKDAFAKLGLKADDLNGFANNTAGLMEEVGLRLSNVTKDSDRTRLSMEIFGRSGSKLNPIFAQGEKGLAALNKRFKELGGGLSEDAIDATGEADQALREYDVAMTSLKGNIAASVLPTFNKWATSLASTIGSFSRSEQGSHALRAALGALTVVAGVLAVEMIAPWVPFIVGVVAAGLAIDDLTTFAKGGKSAIGEFLDLVFGKGSGDSIAKQIREDWKSLNDEIGKSPTAWGKFEEASAIFGSSIVRFFEEDIPAAIDVMNQRVNAGTATTAETVGSWFATVGPAIATGGTLSGTQWIDNFSTEIENGLPKIMAAFDKLIEQAEAHFKSALKDGSLSVLTAGNSDAIQNLDRVENQIRTGDSERKGHAGLSGAFGSAAKNVSVNGTSQQNTYNITVNSDNANAGDDVVAATKGKNAGDRDALVAALNHVTTP